uniref:PDZ domain-containing protein n=1 Tax=Panagrolaimus sp. ES5 TaxID=591445 RepID=A0AC34GB42_9BILA
MSAPMPNTPPDSSNPELKEIPDLSQHLVEIELEKDPEKGFGFNIVGGIDEPYVPGCSGIFISRINPEGPAAKDGRLRLGDRIAMLNDISLSFKTHSDAVDIFRQASGKVKLLIEQDAESVLLSHLIYALTR